MTKEIIPLQRYQSLEHLEDGGTATLYKVFDLQTNQSAVLKFALNPLRSKRQERIAREAHAYEYLGPLPGLVRFLRYEANQGVEEGAFLALEFLAGQTLRKYLNHAAFSEKKTLSIVKALCQIVGQLHERGVIHRDLSLNNVLLLDGSEEVRLLDLGLALVPTTDGLSYEPHDMGSVGTSTTRALEVSTRYSGDKRSDIYSLGCLLFQLSSGFDLNRTEMLDHLHRATFCTKALRAVILRCVEQNPQARYQTVKELDSALTKVTAKKVISPLALLGGSFLIFVAFYFFVVFIVESRLPKREASSPNSPTMFLVEKPLLPIETPITIPLVEQLPSKEDPAPKKQESLPPKKAAKVQPSAPTPSLAPQKSLTEEEDSGLKDLPFEGLFKPLPPAGPTQIEIRSGLSEKTRKR